MQTTHTSKRLDVSIRWMIRKDFQQVLAIENQSFVFPWTHADLVGWLRNQNVIGMVAERGEDVVGFMVYELYKRRLEIRNFAVDEYLRLQGIGRQMMERLIGKLSRGRRDRLYLNVAEGNVSGQLFLRAMGFRCVSIVPRPWEETDQDAYRFVYRHGRPQT